MISNRPLVVIDPGHGGRDPGAIGKSGTQEKAVTLAIALELRRVLERTGEYRVAMTRSQDQTVSLSDRLSFARQRDADLLIAIHADASPDRSVRGASVYVSSGQGVRHLAANAGNSSRIAQALSQPDARLRPGSAGLQQSMIEQLADEVKMVVSPARDGHLYVLGSRSIPSVLLETGFISNRQDEALLKQPAHRRLLVEAIKDAIDDYFGGLKAAAPRA
jgi:N-acetylmuramoyl-L-alanine amidase